MRVSVTTIEQFRRVMTEEWASEAELIAQVKGQPFEPSWQMKAGTAWHAALEGRRPDEEDDGAVRFGDYWISLPALERTRALVPSGACEVKISVPWQTAYGPVNVVSQTDLLVGATVIDHKAKFSTLDIKPYEPSLQWRFYLENFGAKRFQYMIWQFWEPKNWTLELADMAQCSFFPYVGMRQDCQRWLDRFMDWCYFRDLLPFLNREGRSPELEAA